MSLNPLATELNEILQAKCPTAFELLSDRGRKLYYPKGILTQSAEAKQKATRFNATIGIATEDGAPMILPSIAGQIGDVSAQDAVTYAPPPGRPGLRDEWRKKLLVENPTLADKQFGLPIRFIGVGEQIDDLRPFTAPDFVAALFGQKP